MREKDHKVFNEKFGDRYVRLIQVGGDPCCLGIAPPWAFFAPAWQTMCSSATPNTSVCMATFQWYTHTHEPLACHTSARLADICCARLPAC